MHACALARFIHTVSCGKRSSDEQDREMTGTVLPQVWTEKIWILSDLFVFQRKFGVLTTVIHEVPQYSSSVLDLIVSFWTESRILYVIIRHVFSGTSASTSHQDSRRVIVLCWSLDGLFHDCSSVILSVTECLIFCAVAEQDSILDLQVNNTKWCCPKLLWWLNAFPEMCRLPMIPYSCMLHDPSWSLSTGFDNDHWDVSIDTKMTYTIKRVARVRTPSVTHTNLCKDGFEVWHAWKHRYMKLSNSSAILQAKSFLVRTVRAVASEWYCVVDEM